MKLLTETDRYQAIHDLVLRVCNLSELPEEYSDPEDDQWINIVFVCDDYSGYEDCELFYAAVHKIRWGQYPDRGYTEIFKALLDLVVTELLRDGEAFNSWSHHETLHIALGDAEGQERAEFTDGPRCFTYEHRAYLNGRMFNDVLYSKQSVVAEREIDKKEDVELFEFERYEGVVLRLIPEAAAWDKYMWADERNVYDALLQRYGVNFNDHAKSYNELIRCLTDFWAPYCEEYREVVFPLENSLNINVLSYGLAKVIWPNLTEDTLANLFLRIYKNVEKCGCINGESPMRRKLFSNRSLDGEVLKNSWLAKVVSEWVASGNCPGTEPFAVKKASFNLAMRW